MDHIWAPWRSRYILGKKSSSCIFCAKASRRDDEGGESNDEQNYVLFRMKSCFALLNTFPYNPGHIMVAPYQHAADLSELSEQVRAELLDAALRCQGALKNTVKPDGFNLGVNLGAVAGAGIVDHVHLHIVPRWQGDTNFMPVLADTRVLSEGLAEVYSKLSKAV